MALKPITDRELDNLTRLQKELPDGYLVLTDAERRELRNLLLVLRRHIPLGLARYETFWQEATSALYLLDSK